MDLPLLMGMVWASSYSATFVRSRDGDASAVNDDGRKFLKRVALMVTKVECGV